MPTEIAYLDMTAPAADPLAARFGTAEDHQVAGQYRHPQGQRQRLMVRVLLRALLSRHHPTPAALWRILRAPDGAPHLAIDDPARPVPFISLSHSGDMVACAVSATGPIGIDIERIRPDRPVAALAGSAFGPRETAAVEAAGSDAFYRIWTLREALAKASGAGFGLLMNRTDLVPATPEAPALPANGANPEWRFAYWQLPEAYGLGLVRPTDPNSEEVLAPFRFSEP